MSLSSEKISDCLKRCRMFASLPEADLDALCGLARVQEYARGTLLFSEGEAAAGFFIVGSGRVKIYKLSSDGKERILHIVHSGDTFAEAAIFGDGRYPAFAETLNSSELVFLPGVEFLDLLHNRSGIAINMIAGLSQFLRQFAHQIEELTFKDVPARLAGYGIALSDLRTALQMGNQSRNAGNQVAGNREIPVQAGVFLTSAEDVAELVVGVHDGRPVFLRDVAEV
ncbi:MAG: efflux RND transporter permease subunit, partial [Geopsychrobacter sp.]|nr:efflux RND transporter permease subunit [Geopsychrobacter sp.]